MNKPFLHIFFIFCLFGIASNAAAQTDTTAELVLRFKPSSIALTAMHKQQIAAFKKVHCGDTTWKVRVASASQNGNKSWDRLDKVITLLTDTTKNCSIKREKIIFRCADSMERESVLLIWKNDDDEGPNMPPPPNPKYLKQ